MHKRIWLFTIPLALLSLSGGMAIGKGSGTKVGAADGFDIEIGNDPDTGDLFAKGVLGTVRSESLSTFAEDKWIGCWIDAIAGSAMLTCWGKNAAEESVRCSSLDPAMIAAAAGLNADSLVRFSIAPGSVDNMGTCLSVRVENISKYGVKLP